MPSGIYQHKKGYKRPPFSEKWKENIRKSLKDRIAWNKNKKCPRGKNANNWQGGKTSLRICSMARIEYKNWRNQVFVRDNWICQKCGKRGNKLEAHHIQNFTQYPELRFIVKNGITFCYYCHHKFHIKYGIKNNTKEQLEEFLKVA